jgi:amino acid transporter
MVTGTRELPVTPGPSEIGRPGDPDRPIGEWAFAGVAIASIGGPLAIAGLIAPAIAGDSVGSGGLEMLVALVVFIAPLALWLRWSREVSGPGGLYGFVEAAAGRRVARAQAAIWTFSYLLYIVYTTTQIVYDLLPQVLGGERAWQTPLALLIPAALVAVMVAGRTAALLALGLLAAGQVALAAVLDGVAIGHLGLPLSSLGTSAGGAEIVQTGAQTSLLYICAGLPLFLGGELRDPARTIRRGLSGAYLLTGALVVLAVAPLAAAPELARTAVPGAAVLARFVGGAASRAIGIATAASIGGVMLAEFLALTRLLHAAGGWPVRRVTLGLGAFVLAAAPLMLIDPAGIYDALTRPSLIALWLSQLIVFLVYPRFAHRRGQAMAPAWTLSIVASACGVWAVECGQSDRKLTARLRHSSM